MLMHTPRSRRQRAGLWSLLASALLLVSCSSTQPPPPPHSIPPGTPVTPALPAANLAGRLSLTVTKPNGDARASKRMSAGFELLGTPGQGTLTLTGPFGITLAQADWGPQGARLRSLNKGEQRFENLAALSQATFGQVLPLEALPAWLQMRPWPERPYQLLAPQGSNLLGQATDSATPPRAFEQLGWTISSTASQNIQISHPNNGNRIEIKALIESP